MLLKEHSPNPPVNGRRRHSICNVSIPSSKYTDDELPFSCTRELCHCELANRQDPDTFETHSSGSISLRRRHAEYFHRPPVFAPSVPLSHLNEQSFVFFPNQNTNDPEYCEQCKFCSDAGRWCGRLATSQSSTLPNPLHRTASEVDVGGYEKQLNSFNATWVTEPLIVHTARLVDENSDPREPYPPAVFSNILTPSNESSLGEDTYLQVARNDSQESLRRCRTIIQSPTTECTRLKSYRDVRLGLHENWAIVEGSLVICLHPSFTDLDKMIIPDDEFPLRYGDVYIICRMYADMWALCARLRLSETITPIECSDMVEDGFENIKFIPLCALTLAANFGAFERRCANYRRKHPQSTVFPSGGLFIKPPERTHSLVASQEFHKYKADGQFHIPRLVFDLCREQSEVASGTAYTPLDTTVQGMRLHLVHNAKPAEGRNTLRRVWRKLVSCEGGASNEWEEAKNACLPPDLSLDKEVAYAPEELSSLQKEIDTEKQNVLKNQSPVRKRRSIREFLFGSRKPKEEILSDPTSLLEEVEESDDEIGQIIDNGY